jgi:hypothetical protein
MDNIYRYMGVKPFEASNRAIFYGRDTDIESLYNLILSEKLVVLFGKSGYGKSSLLNAGVLPLFRKGNCHADVDDENAYHSTIIEVRLGTYVEGTTLSPLETTQAKLVEKCPITEGGDFLNSFYNSEASPSLWYHFKQRQKASEGGRFIVVFDQFEEFFTYPQSLQERFKRELAELLYSDIPQAIRKRLSELPLADKQQLAQTMEVKAVFGIRADRMSFLDSMKEALPAILHKRYELRSLTSAQAREAIVKPSGMTAVDLRNKGMNDVAFITSPFEYTEGALAKVIKELSSERTGLAATGIEAFQLQILCQYIESQVESGKISDIDGNGMPDVTTDDLPDMSNLYESYYRRQLDRLDPSVKRTAQLVLENGLLSEDPKTGDGRRMSVDSQLLKSQFSVNDALLRELENTYLVRKEPNSVGGESLEISHDTLIAPMLKMKKERRAKEDLEKAKRKEETKQKEETKRKAEEETKLLMATEIKRRRRAIFLLTLATIGFLFAAAVGIWAYEQRNKAIKAEHMANISSQEAIAASKIADAERRKALASEALTKIALREADSLRRIAMRSNSLAQNDKRLAIESASKAAASEKETQEALGDLKKVQMAKLKIEVSKYMTSAQRLIEMGKYPIARNVLNEALLLDNNNAEVLAKLKEIVDK